MAESEALISPSSDVWKTEPCPIGCGGLVMYNESAGEFPPWACERCKLRFPPSLIKAVGDDFEYALELRTGEVIRFRSAVIHGEWATLDGVSWGVGRVSALPFECPRGVDVRISEIVWCADAPDGS